MARTKRLILAPLLLLLTAGYSFAAPPVVTSVSPTPQTISAPVDSPIVIEFDTPLDPTTVNAASMRIFGRWSGPASGVYILENGNQRIRFTPSEPFFAGEWITVSLSKNITGMTGEPLATGFWCNFWTAAAPGTLDLKEISQISVRLPGEGHVQTYGAYAGDLNNDGWTDLAAPNELSSDVRVFLNDGTGGYSDFTIFPLVGGSFPSTNEGADFNGDGVIDMVVGSGGNDRMHVLLGNGVGGFAQTNSYQAGNSVRGVTIIDLDADGIDDIVTANRNSSNISMFHGIGDGSFAAPSSMEGGGASETSIATADINEDGIPDIFVGSLNSNEMTVLIGDGMGGLTQTITVSAGGRPWMIAVGDLNGDGHVDVVSANSTSNNAGVMFGDGMGGLTPAVTYPTGDFTLAIDLGDIDGDGDLDMVSSNFSGNDWTLYENDGTGIFINPVSFPASSTGSCAILHDRDNDGDLDMTGIDETDDLLFLFKNAEIIISADSSFGNVPYSVQFTGNTSRAVNSWSWDFGDSGSSSLMAPLHAYTEPGFYSVAVTIGTAEGDFSETESGLIYALAETLTVANVTADLFESVRVDISLNNHVPITEIIIPFHWAGSFGLILDSVTTAGLRTGNLTLANNGIIVVNNDFTNKRATRKLVTLPGNPIAPGEGPILSLYLRTPPLQLPGINPITIGPYALIEPTLTMRPGAITPEIQNGSISMSCCIGSAGNVNNDPNDITDIADLTMLIDHLFINFPALSCEQEANIDGDAGDVIDIADLTFLIDHLFINFPPTALCR